MNTAEELQLSLPRRRAPLAESFDWRHKAVEEWLGNLPLTNLGETSRQVFRAVHDVNRLDIAPKARLDFLEQIREMADYIAQGLRKHYLAASLPLVEKTRKVLMLALVFLQELAVGYEIAVEDMRGRRDRRRLAHALYRAMQYRGRVLLECWLVYRTPPPGAWQRLHRLYRLCETLRVQDQRIHLSVDGGPRERTTPAAAYQRPVLVAAAGPGRLTVHEILDAWRVLGCWADSASLDQPGSAEGAAIRVPRDADAPPHAAMERLNLADDRGLRTDTLRKRAARELARTGHPFAFWRRQPLADIHPDLLQRLMMSVDAAPVRQHARMRATARVQVVAGLARLHAALGGEQAEGQPGAGSSASRFASRDIASADAGDADVWDLIYPGELLREIARNHHADDTGPAAAPIEAAAEDWHLVNLSSRGYCLLREHGVGGRARVGELILLRELAGRDLPWQLGTIRWLRSRRDDGLQMGVEIIASAPVATWVRACADTGDEERCERALLIAGGRGDGERESLIVARTIGTEGMSVTLHHDRRERRLSLRRECDTTPQYRQFEVVDE